MVVLGHGLGLALMIKPLGSAQFLAEDLKASGIRRYSLILTGLLTM